MCGFAAIVGQGGVSSDDVWRMLEMIHHRGPDSAGVVSLETAPRQLNDRGMKQSQLRALF